MVLDVAAGDMMQVAGGRPDRSPEGELRCSVVIPAYNASRWIERTVASALAQTLPDIEVIVVDDGSADDTTDRLSAFGDRLTLIRQANAGVAAARNAGAARATADHIAFLDSDDVWSPDKIERQVALFDENPDVVLVHCGVREIDENDLPLTGEVLRGCTGDVHRDLILQRPAISGGGSGAMFARWAFDSVGGFDTRFSTSADWHLWLRITRLGPVAMVPEPLLDYRIHGSNMHLDVMAEARDMFLGLREAIAEDPIAAELGNLALARCHRTMAGGFWNEKTRIRFVRHAASAILREPSTIAWLAGRLARRFPHRRI